MKHERKCPSFGNINPCTSAFSRKSCSLIQFEWLVTEKEKKIITLAKMKKKQKNPLYWNHHHHHHRRQQNDSISKYLSQKMYNFYHMKHVVNEDDLLLPFQDDNHYEDDYHLPDNQSSADIVMRSSDPDDSCLFTHHLIFSLSYPHSCCRNRKSDYLPVLYSSSLFILSFNFHDEVFFRDSLRFRFDCVKLDHLSTLQHELHSL